MSRFVTEGRGADLFAISKEADHALSPDGGDVIPRVGFPLPDLSMDRVIVQAGLPAEHEVAAVQMKLDPIRFGAVRQGKENGDSGRRIANPGQKW